MSKQAINPSMKNLAETMNRSQLEIEVCELTDLVINSGVCALVNGMQVAIFHIPSVEPFLFAISNWDPIGKANVLSRGIVGDIDGQIVVASPLYKQHFSLTDGHCLEDEAVSVPVYQVHVENNKVIVQLG